MPNGDGSSCADCCGVPNGDGSSCDGACGACNDDTSCLDDCGVPNGDGSSCADCCGVPNGDGSSCDGLCGACNDDISCLDDCGIPNGDNSSCSGCTDDTACNYDTQATLDDGSCINCGSIGAFNGNYFETDNISFSDALGVTISFWVHDEDFSQNPEDFATYIDFGSIDTYRYVIRNRSGKIEAFMEGEGIPNQFNGTQVDWTYPFASVATGIGNTECGSSTDGWHYITAVYCATNIKLYVDGQFANSSVSNVYFSSFDLSSESAKRIGSAQYIPGQLLQPADANIDEVRIWSRALSAEEIFERYGELNQTGLTISEEIDLVGYWKFDCSYVNEVSLQDGNDVGVVLSTIQYCEHENCSLSTYEYLCPEDLEGNADCNSCDPPEGCTDELACNFDPLAVISIQSNCIYIEDYCPNIENLNYYDCECKCLNDMDVDGVCDEIDCSPEVYNPEQDCTGTQEILPIPDKKSIIVFDLLGRQVDSEKKNLLLLERHEDGSVYKKHTIE